jgi:hypothetical protein
MKNLVSSEEAVREIKDLTNNQSLNTMVDMEQFEPQTEQEVEEYEKMTMKQALENVQNEKNGRFIFWLIVSLFGASAIAAVLA